eukprot:TRINITY_DN882_c1_g1_i1.p1 TRINITY_DN882_c1_g1~~TRINITY_DN882_c1_g1_i1.p1  ORF type:complete len:126 (+),score=22.11 TRINITY_DN882_c1_g1_i1:59-436(+)
MAAPQPREICPPPNNMKSLRACLWCSLIRTEKQFDDEGCPNCEPFLQYGRNRRDVDICTSASFDGIITMLDPDASWVAKWNRINQKTFVRGVYAVSVNGRLPNSIVKEIQKDHGKNYIPRYQIEE